MNKQKRVLFITNYPSPYRVQFFNELGKHCNLTVTFEESPQQQKHRAAEWFDNNYKNFNAVFLKQTIKAKIKGRTVYYFPQIKKNIKQGKYDHIIIGGYSTPSSITAIRYLKKNKIPYILNADGGQKRDGNGVLEKIKTRIISGAEAYLSPSKNTDEYFQFYGAPASNIFRYPFTSLFRKDILNKPLTKAEKDSIRSRLNIPKDKTVLLSVGQLVHGKGFDIFLEALNGTDNDVIAYIVGGTPSDELKSLQNKLGLSERVHFIAFQNKEALKDYYDMADIFVFPTRRDAWGLVINEAMSRGLPIITTTACVAGVELVNDKTGILVEPESAEQLAIAINQMLKRKTINQISANCLTAIKEYTIENMAKRHIEILSKLPGAQNE